MFKRVCLGLVCALALGADPASAQESPQLRGFWVDTFNSPLNTPADAVAAVDGAVAANANALFVQVRRRGDVWFISAYESKPDGVPIQPGFDPLAAIIQEAHARNIQVHAFVAVAAVYSRHPVILGLPSDPNHVFNLHGGFDAATGTIVPGPNNWLTRTLLPAGTPPSVTFQGHRFGGDFWVDLGHPDAAAYSTNVMVDLIERYDLDGLHLDRIRYPEIGVSGQTPATGANIGYNTTSVARFRRHYALPPDAPDPAPDNTAWAQWRRDQVTAVVRRTYLETIARKPHMVVSAATIAFGNAPSSWPVAEAYWRVYQDWRAWTEEGVLDLNVPMIYQREHTPAGATFFINWIGFAQAHQYSRAAAIGQGVFLNAIEGSLRQSRRVVAPAALPLAGVLFFSMANPDVAVANNPFALPAPANTPRRGLPEFASAYTTGRSVDGLTAYEPPMGALFAQSAPVPVFSWKASPQVGHLKGIVRNDTGEVLDTAAVQLLRRDDGTTPAAGRTDALTSTDGNGFYGGVDLAAGTYTAVITPAAGLPYTSCPATVSIGQVTTFDVAIDRQAPTSTIVATPNEIWPPKGQLVALTISGEAGDVGLGLSRVVVTLTDEYGEIAPEPVEVLLSGGAASWSVTFQVPAHRRGDDRDGRVFSISASVADLGCNTTVVQTSVLVPHDQRGS